MAGLRCPLNESVEAAINKNKTALSAAIKKRLADPEDMDAHDAVEKLIIKTAIEAGMDKQEAQDIPWMETYAVPGDSTVAGDLEELEIEIEDALADADTTSTGSSKEGSTSIDDESMKIIEDTVAKRLDEIGAAYTKGASDGVYLIGGGDTKPIQDNIIKAIEDKNKAQGRVHRARAKDINIYAVSDGGRVFALGIGMHNEVDFAVEIKNDKPVGAPMKSSAVPKNLIDKVKVVTNVGNPWLSIQDNPYDIPQDVLDNLPSAAARVFMHSFPYMLAEKNPAITGKVKVPELSKTQSQIISLAKEGEQVLAPSGATIDVGDNPFPTNDSTEELVGWLRRASESAVEKSVNESIFEQIVKVKRQLLK